MIQRFGTRVRQVLVAALATLLLSASPLVVHADNYGSGPYGQGVYGGSESSSDSSSSDSSSSSSSSSASSESTVVETPSGLEVAINLSDGQVIPSTGYTITVTPLNGQGKTFDKVEIYLDGTLVFSGTPDSTGTLKWFWDTVKYPASKVKIIVYGPGSGTTTHEFNVTVQPPSTSTSTNPQSTTATSTPSGGWPTWLWWLIVPLVLLVSLWIIWLIARRRHRNQDQTPPTVFPPTQQ